MKRLLLVAGLLAGCADVPLECHDYEKMGPVKRVCTGDWGPIDAACTDPGHPKKRETMVRNPGGAGYHTEYDNLAACWASDPGILFLPRNAPAWLLFHEFCHVAGGDEATCGRLFPRPRP